MSLTSVSIGFVAVWTQFYDGEIQTFDTEGELESMLTGGISNENLEQIQVFELFHEIDGDKKRLLAISHGNGLSIHVNNGLRPQEE